jgi:hypothetical protein
MVSLGPQALGAPVLANVGIERRRVRYERGAGVVP